MKEKYEEGILIVAAELETVVILLNGSLPVTVQLCQ